jgi:hypothetical protein
MNGVNAAGLTRGWPATVILRLNGQQQLVAPVSRNAEAEEALVAAVAFPPRVGEVRPIAALLPEILARYGLAEEAKDAGLSSIDCLA